MSPAADATTGAPVVRLRDGECAMFGYGSLLSRASMESTFGRAYTGPRVAGALDGWRRSWDVAMPNEGRFVAIEHGAEFVPDAIVYLNVRPSSGAPVNGLLYVVEAADMRAFDEREWIYDRVAVTDRVLGARVEGGEAYVYVARPERQLDASAPRARAALRRTYLDIVERGLGELGPEFRAGYERSTDPVPVHRVFDDVRREAS
jgi:cation transport regulator ChaC